MMSQTMEPSKLPEITITFFFFSSRRRHTRLQGDWSSDVCSSDLADCRSPHHPDACPPSQEPDRKSTRLNSSHLVISYAVFCLKKKKKKTSLCRLYLDASTARITLRGRWST